MVSSTSVEEPHPPTTGVDDEETLLTEVDCEEDRCLILDVLRAIKMCRRPDPLCTSWTLIPCSTGYTLVAYLPRPQQHQQHQIEVTHDDINIIECVNMLRVRVGVAQFPQGTWGLKVHITSHTAAVSFTTYDSMRINVRRAMVTGDRKGWLGTMIGGWVQGPNVAKRKRVPGDS